MRIFEKNPCLDVISGAAGIKKYANESQEGFLERFFLRNQGKFLNKSLSKLLNEFLDELKKIFLKNQIKTGSSFEKNFERFSKWTPREMCELIFRAWSSNLWFFLMEYITVQDTSIKFLKDSCLVEFMKESLKNRIFDEIFEAICKSFLRGISGKSLKRSNAYIC